MRWQRHSESDGFWRRSGLTGALRLLPSMILGVALFLGAMAALGPRSEPAVADEIIEGGDMVDLGEGSRGMSATNPRVRRILGSHSGDFVTVCVAGCAGPPSVVQVLPKPVTHRDAYMLPSAGGSPARSYEDSDSVVCVGGCPGARNRVVQNLPDLPPPRREVDARNGAGERAAAPPPAPPAAQPPPEPLDGVR